MTEIIKKKLIRVTTVPESFGLFNGQPRFMGEYFDVVGVSSPGEMLGYYADKEGIKMIPVEMTRTISPLKDLISVWKLCKIFHKEKPFIVHSHTPKAGVVAMLAAFLTGVPHRLHTVAGLPLIITTGNRRRILSIVEKLTYACATKIFPNSFGLYDIILKNKFTDAEKLKVLGNGSSNGIDTAHFDPDLFADDFKSNLRSELKIEPTDFIYLFVGRLVADKGINELVKAFKNVNKKFPQTKLVLLGYSENELNPLSIETDTEILENQSIIAAGFKSDVRPYFAISDVLTFPSYREGFPNVVLQAGAMGIPSIVSDINGCNEIITEGVNGIIIPVKDTFALEKEMKLLYENSDLRISMRKNARKIIVDKYSRSTIWNAVLEEYRALERQQ